MGQCISAEHSITAKDAITVTDVGLLFHPGLKTRGARALR
jgi:hypothetical protein